MKPSSPAICFTGLSVCWSSHFASISSRSRTISGHRAAELCLRESREGLGRDVQQSRVVRGCVQLAIVLFHGLADPVCERMAIVPRLEPTGVRSSLHARRKNQQNLEAGNDDLLAAFERFRQFVRDAVDQVSDIRSGASGNCHSRRTQRVVEQCSRAPAFGVECLDAEEVRKEADTRTANRLRRCEADASIRRDEQERVSTKPVGREIDIDGAGPGLNPVDTE